MADNQDLTPQQQQDFDQYDSNPSKKSFAMPALGSKPKFSLDIGKIPGVGGNEGEDENKPGITPSN